MGLMRCNMHIVPIRMVCTFKQGTHCTKIGSKCVEDRWFNGGPCLIAEKKKHQYGQEIVDQSETNQPTKKV